MKVKTFKSQTNKIFERTEAEKRPTIVTYDSGFAAILQPLEKERARSLAAESARDLIAARTRAEHDLANGNTTLGSDLAAELGINVNDG